MVLKDAILVTGKEMRDTREMQGRVKCREGLSGMSSEG